MRIIFATGNEGKLREIREILSDLGLEIVSMKEAGIKADIVEDGKSFKENALIKARAISKIAKGELVMADDSGLVIDALNGEPGIYSARYMGEDTSYDIKNNAILERMKGFKGEERSARFVCAVAAVITDDDGQVREYTTEGAFEGVIADEIAGANGFGYDPIFYVPEKHMTSAELTSEEKNELSHRGKALRAMKEVLKEIV
ncbi:MAG: RdgB/HAM1 family non-canonical purine NTP pyrophosphatase [Lachnospiraceae bacterium]|nr:RdgB/HAM1 family non-canonical purine NTP pyrophosphatase [Lachnospiraceae bacterium]MBR5789245.1 RdgB/HAM1 family non-canonical purine NTP pyrophosphatase [Lachnospiraceae bacterium]